MPPTPRESHTRNELVLWYLADPMCSWCWGFSPVIEVIREDYRERMKITLVLGGLRTGVTEAMTPQLRDQILDHWHHVHDMTGQPFRFEGAMPAGFVYDTEPASRAVVAVSRIDPEATFPMFRVAQAAFYAEQQDVTQPEVLSELAAGTGVEMGRFLREFHSDEVKQKTRIHFHMARQVGVRGFPTVILQNPGGYTLLTTGYRPLAELRPQIDAWLG